MHKPSLIQRWLHEKTLQRYFIALERGDIQTLLLIMHQATNDAVLEELLFERHRTYHMEEDLQATSRPRSALDITKASLPLPSEHAERMPKHVSTRQTYRQRWLQGFAFALLLCILIGSVLFLQTWRSHTTLSQSQVSTALCLVSGVPLTTGPGTTFKAIAATSANDVWVVGQAEQKPLIEHWDGQRWEIRFRGTQLGTLYSISALSSNDVWAVGVLSIQFPAGPFPALAPQPLIEHWDGHQWSLVASPKGTKMFGYGLNSVAALSVDDVWAVGYQENLSPDSTLLLVEHWDGKQWQVEPLPSNLADGVFTSIAAAGRQDVWAVGYTGEAGSGKSQPLIMHWDGRHWNQIPHPKEKSTGSFTPGGYLISISGSSATDFWATGVFDYLVHWDGLQWRMVPLAGMGSGPARVYATSTTDLWLAGGQSSGPKASAPIPVLRHWNGTSWQEVPQPSPTGFLTDLTIVDGKLWAVGASTNSDGDPLVPFIETNICP